MKANTRHKWNGKVKKGREVVCVKCGCVKGYLCAVLTYFTKDNVYFKAPKCQPNEILQEAPNMGRLQEKH